MSKNKQMIDSTDNYHCKKTVQTAGYNYSTTQPDIRSALSEILSMKTKPQAQLETD